MDESNVLWFADMGLDDLPLVGGKDASLGELIKLDGVRVPDGFAVTTRATAKPSPLSAPPCGK